jgi:hypothetical protein
MIPKQHDGNVYILDCGFPTQWKTTQLQNVLIDKIATAFGCRYPDKLIYVLIPNWADPKELADLINNRKPDMLVVCDLTDNTGFPDGFLKTLPTQVVNVGYTTSGIFLDFFAIGFLEYFKTYTEEELTPTTLTHLFLSYNRKPHDHRVRLINLLEEYNVADRGLITLGGSEKYKLAEVEDQSVDGENAHLSHIYEPANVWSLGSLGIWNSCLFSLVSETSNMDHAPYISEKTYKPIVGMRPFVVNGNSAVYPWLRSAGIDCFEDLFPVQKLIDSCADRQYLIAQRIKILSSANLDKLYQTLLPRLQSNRTCFFEYALNQKNRANSFEQLI